MKPSKFTKIALFFPLFVALGQALSLPTQVQALELKAPLILARLDLPNPFIDIEAIEGKAAILQLTHLGVILANSDRFNPDAPIQRDEFIAWLIKAYNVMHDAPIRLSGGSSTIFPDVLPDNPYSVYIQSAYEAGFIVGFEDGGFRPNDPLTREQMIALKSQLDSKGNSRRSPAQLRQYLQHTRGFHDVAEMDDRYLSYIAFDVGNAAGGRNFERLYGTTRLYQPKAAVTRAEAAILVSKFRKGKPIDSVLESIGI
ncbi:S-layer domain protein [[Synechococcus] sp. NIES-970]|uniref:S-layer homology domain-containing protein n=1 Tax=Picosynechococcus sp. NKBG15041c TaxID=1407650 RepID=UPI0003FFCF06|nr:S-layer homology domain-containing protein [Picosynechococcus sp. NKBG15041c]BAW96872.1 S-layer domain protein [[Synechococcus] sp. NIES-970]